MILIWGWKVRFKTLAEGVFFCQVCGGDRPYHLRQGRRWFTFFWLPLIPLNNVGEQFVECQTCKTAYKESVLTQPTSADLSAHLVLATRAALVWVLRSMTPTPRAIAAALAVLARTAGRPFSEAELEADVAHLDIAGLPDQLTALAGALNEHGRETFLAGCARVATADGSVPDTVRPMLDNVAASLGMSPAHARGVIAQVTEQADA